MHIVCCLVSGACSRFENVPSDGCIAPLYAFAQMFVHVWKSHTTALVVFVFRATITESS